MLINTDIMLTDDQAKHLQIGLWLPGPHLQTLRPVIRRRRHDPQMREERIELPAHIVYEELNQ